MKKKLHQIVFLFLLSISLFSCTKEEQTESQAPSSTLVNAKFVYSNEELQVLTLINNYRQSKGLSTLEKVDYISTVAEGHDKYMISVGQISHNYFQDRHEALVTNLGAKVVSENLAYNYSTPESVLNGWLKSDGHRTNLEGDYTHFGIAIRANAQGEKYYTNLFMKK